MNKLSNMKLLVQRILDVKQENDDSEISSSLDTYKSLVKEASNRQTTFDRRMEIKEQLKLIRKQRKLASMKEAAQ